MIKKEVNVFLNILIYWELISNITDYMQVNLYEIPMRCTLVSCKKTVDYDGDEEICCNNSGQ